MECASAKTGRWNEARAALDQVIEMEARMLGAEHPDTLTSMGNLAWKEVEEIEAQVMRL